MKGRVLLKDGSFSPVLTFIHCNCDTKCEIYYIPEISENTIYPDGYIEIRDGNGLLAFQLKNIHIVNDVRKLKRKEIV